MTVHGLPVRDTERRPFFTPKTLAAYLAISERTVREMLAKGRIPSYKIEGQRRIAAWDVDACCASIGIEPPLVREPEPAPAPTPVRPARKRYTTGPYDTWDARERDYAAILVADPCSYCGASATAVDHIVPVARRGEHAWGNFTATCKRCNSGKCAKSLLRHLLRRLES